RERVRPLRPRGFRAPPLIPDFPRPARRPTSSPLRSPLTSPTSPSLPTLTRRAGAVPAPAHARDAPGRVCYGDERGTPPAALHVPACESARLSRPAPRLLWRGRGARPSAATAPPAPADLVDGGGHPRRLRPPHGRAVPALDGGRPLSRLRPARRHLAPGLDD